MQSRKRKEAATKTARRAVGRMNEVKSKPKEKVRQRAKWGVIKRIASGRSQTAYVDA